MSVKRNDAIRRHNIRVQGDSSSDCTLVFGHGFGCDQQIWRQVAPAFSAQAQVVLFDYMGCGQSDLSAYDAGRYQSLNAYADDLLLLCEALELEQVVFVGHSVSGAIAMLAAIQKPELFQQIIAIGPSPCYLNQSPDYSGGFDVADISTLLEMMERNFFEWAEYLAPVVIGHAADQDTVKELKQTFLRADPLISRKFAEVTFYSDIRPYLASIPVPVTVLYCAADVIVPVEVIQYLERHIPRCKTIELDAAGHYPQLTNPAAVIQAIHHELAAGC